MFNNNLKKRSLQIHQKELENYNESYERMRTASIDLYNERIKSVNTIRNIEKVVNSISNTPKEFNKQFGHIRNEIICFLETEKFAAETYDQSLKSGLNVAGAAVAGIGVATMTPSMLKGIATTFGKISTGTAINTLSSAVAKKSARTMIGRTFASFTIKRGASMAAGRAFLSLAGPVGWGITVGSVGFNLLSVARKNKEIAEEVTFEVKKISYMREILDETKCKIEELTEKTQKILNDLNKDLEIIEGFENINYNYLSESYRLMLGKYVNNTMALSRLLNETV